MSIETKCECRHCGGHIKFEVENYQAGMVVECPHCGGKTALRLPLFFEYATHIRIAVFIVLFIVAAIAIQSHFKTLNEQFDRTAAQAQKGYGNMGKAMEDAKKKAAEATADLAEWNKKLSGATNETIIPQSSTNH
jgi:DNA-directed RNA polymerase subunit RPC12/RpoP